MLGALLPLFVFGRFAMIPSHTPLNERTFWMTPYNFHGSSWVVFQKDYKHVDLVADTYREISIKNGERQKRRTSARLMIHSPQCKLSREFKNFLNNGENKTRLIELIFQVISQESSRALQMLKCDKIYCLKEKHTAAIHRSKWCKRNRWS